MSSASPQQILHIGVQRRRQPRQHQDRGVTSASFYAAEIGLMHGGAMGELLLAEPTLAAKSLYIEADPDPHIHRRMAGCDLTSAHRL